MKHMCECVCAHVYLYGGLKLTLGVFLDHFPLYSLRQGLKMNWELTSSSRLGSQLAQVSSFGPLESWKYR